MQTCAVLPPPLAGQNDSADTLDTLTILFGSGLLYRLDSIADTATVEHGACLYGRVRPDTVHLDHAVFTPIITATALTLLDKSCPGLPLAYWHTHLPHEYTLEGARANEPDKPPEDYCYLSRPDMAFAVGPLGPPLEFVGVGHRLLCWWTRAQILG
ncbi:MAG: hypothetical protein ACREIB_06875, partial [Pseudomonadota bacterium]